jgi:hypothetical protein
MNSSNFETTLPTQSRDSADVRSDTNEWKNDVSSEGQHHQLNESGTILVKKEITAHLQLAQELFDAPP